MASVEILAFDVSYSATGFAKLNIKYGSEGSMIVLSDRGCFDNPKFKMGFSGLRESSFHMERTKIGIANQINKTASTGFALIEMPAFSQSAIAAMAIGMCWGSIGQMNDSLCIEPAILKEWSGSKKGDAKKIVKEKVTERVYLGKDASNDNIVDAVGICLMFSDLISTAKHEYANRK